MMCQRRGSRKVGHYDLINLCLSGRYLGSGTGQSHFGDSLHHRDAEFLILSLRKTVSSASLRLKADWREDEQAKCLDQIVFALALRRLRRCYGKGAVI